MGGDAAAHRGTQLFEVVLLPELEMTIGSVGYWSPCLSPPHILQTWGLSEQQEKEGAHLQSSLSLAEQGWAFCTGPSRALSAAYRTRRRGREMQSRFFPLCQKLL